MAKTAQDRSSQVELKRTFWHSAARNMVKVSAPEIILSKSAHFSFTKICHLLNLKARYADIDESFRVDVSSVKKLINDNTVAVVGTAGTAELGVIDPIEELADVALQYNSWFHVDAAFGGLVIPFLKPIPCSFDFKLKAVKSLTVDPHKMGMAAIPAGGILFRDCEALDYIQTETPYLTDKFQYTLVGTRSGAAAASTWAVFRYLGVDGYRKVVSKCMKTTRLMADGLWEAGFKLVLEPTLNIVAFRSSGNTKEFAEKLWEKGWSVSYVPRYDCIRLVIMPHVKKRHALSFLKDISQIEKL